MSRKPEKLHPYIREATEQLRQGRITRREFLRMATLLGASAVTASALAACGGPAAPEAVATTAPAAAATPMPVATPVGTGIKRGGVFRSAMQLQRLDHPARLSWVQGANVVRQVGEYLAETGADNITRPMLLDRWDASEDVKTWTLHLRRGIKFNNGDDFTADDVMFTFSQWLDPDVGSSTLGLMSYLDGMQSVEKVDDYTVRLHLEEGNIGVPEHLFHYPNIVLHRHFEGDYVRQPVGTGAFTLVDYAEGERATFRRRNDYWRNGEDGQPLPYLDEVIYVSLEKDAGLSAMRGRQVDSMYQPRPSDFLALRDLPEFTVYPASTAQAFVLRMRVDLEPWNDVRVRNALKKCQDRARILQLSYFGEGDLSLDAHVAPVHPAYCEQPIPEYDPEGSRALLAEAGYPNGLRVTLATKNDQAEPEIATALRELAAPGGFDITLDITEPGGYWDRWTEVDLGITAWTHRPLDTMVLPLAYIADADGEPVPWNETRWVDDEFTTLLRQAEATLDVEVRRGLMCQLQGIMQERGAIGNSYWNNVWTITRSEFKGVVGHPTSYDFLYEVWKDA
jgi:peptide/nickel transport system substrate-binding protein